jgi:hypothetical protein
VRVATKAEYLDRAALGLLGNTMPSWPSVEAALADGHREPVMVRCRVPDSPYMRADVPIAEAQSVIDEFVRRGARPGSLYLTHMTTAVGRRLNAEVWRSPSGLYLHYSTDQTHLRAALDGPTARHVQNATAYAVLRWACCPDSFDDLMELLDLYPDHCVELTAYDREIGSLPGRNTVIWEVRLY